MSRCSHSLSRPELCTQMLTWCCVWEWISLSGMLEAACVSLEDLIVCISFQLSIQFFHPEIIHKGVLTPQKSANPNHQSGRSFPWRACGYIFTSASLYCINLWVNTGILYAAPHSDSVGTIPSQYSIVYQPSSLQHSSAEYIVWPKVTQPVSGEVRILTWDVLCLQGPCSSTPFCCFWRGQALDTDCLALPLDQLHNCGQVTYILYP